MNRVRRYQVLEDGPHFGAVAVEVPPPARAPQVETEIVWLSVGGALLPPTAFLPALLVPLNV